MSRPGLDLIFAGSGHFGLPTLRALLRSGDRVVQVVSQPDRPAGRGMKLTPTPISQLALENGIPLLRTADMNAESLPPADVMVVIAFGQKIAEHVTRHARLGAVNLHGSILPKFRGAAPVNWAIIAGERQTGNSIIRLAPKMDAGAILAQSRFGIGPLETAGELHDRLAEDGAPLMLRVLDELASGTAVEVEQDHAQATLAKKITRESTRLEFNSPAREVARRIRGMYPWPGCRVKLMDDQREIARLTLVRASHDDRGSDLPALAGQILADGTVACDVGRLVVVEVQPEGRRPMPLEAFRHGHPWREGLWLESIV